MNGPYAPADPAISRRVKLLGLALQRVQRHRGPLDLGRDWGPLLLAWHALGGTRDGVHVAAEDRGPDVMSTFVRHQHGLRWFDELQWWRAVGDARLAENERTHRRDIALRLHGRAAHLGFARQLPALDLWVEGATWSPQIEAVADRALGLAEFLREGPLPDRPGSYPHAYRLARDLGELRARASEDPALVERQLDLLLDGPDGLLCRLGVESLLPEHLASALRTPDETGEAPLWRWLGWVFEAVVGGLADWVYHAAHDARVLSEQGFRGLAFRRALGGLQLATRALRTDTLAQQLDALAEQVAADQAIPAVRIQALAERVARWLDRALPHEGQVPLQRARTLAWAHRFRDAEVAVDVARVEHWLRQFPPAQRWVGECLLDAITYVPRAAIGRSLAFVLDSFGLARDPRCALIQWPCAPDLREDVRVHGVAIPHRSLRAALDEGRQTLVFVDDALLTGGRQEDALEQLLDALDDERTAQLRQCTVTICVALGTDAGIERVGSLLEDRGLQPRIWAGREQRLLSDLGWAEWEAGTLLDDSGTIVSPGSHLADPLFSPHHPAWSGADHQVARSLCEDIGHALLEDLALAEGFSEARRRGAALGAAGLQGTLVMGHRTPRSTLPLLWCRGTWQGRTWIPLFGR